MEHSLLLWALFIISVLIMLVLDLKVFHRPGTKQGTRDALFWSIVWTLVALVFNAGVYIWMGRQPAIEFFTGYMVERSLSMDNLFVFLLIFSYFKIDRRHQHVVLMWGIIGAIVLRLVFILLGSYLVSRFHFVLYIFGAFLVLTGLRLLKKEEKEFDPEKNFFYKLTRKLIPFTHDMSGERLFVRIDRRLHATPLFIVLILIESSDVIFAVDSIPAIFGITRDSFIIFSSNIFAILGLRALYHLIAGLMERFHHLHYGLAAILVFIGVKMLIEPFTKVGSGVSLIVITVLLTASISSSLLFPEKKNPE